MAGAIGYAGTVTVNPPGVAGPAGSGYTGLGGELEVDSTTGLADAAVVMNGTRGMVFGLTGSANATLGSLSGSGAFALPTTTLTVGGVNTNTTYSGAMSGGEALAKVGSGTLTLAGPNSFTGGLTVSIGTVQLGSNTATLGAAAGGVTVNSLLDLNGFSASIGGLSGSGLVTDVAGSGADTVTVGNTAAGNYTFTGGITNGSGTVSVVMAPGTAFQRLSGVDTYTGPTYINGGVLSINRAGAISPSSSIVFGGGALRWSGVNMDVSGQIAPINNPGGAIFYINNQNVTFANSLSGSGGITLGTFIGAQGTDTPGTLTLTAANPGLTGPVTVNGGTLNVANAAALLQNTVTVNNNGYVTFGVPAATLGGLAGAGNVNLGAASLTVGANGAATTFGGTMIGAGGLTKIGSGVTTLSSPQNYAGPTNIAGGTLRVVSSGVGDSVAVGTVIPNSGSGGAAMNGTVVGTGLSIVPGPSSQQGLSFNGNGSYVDILNGVTNLSSTATWTVSAWINTTQTGATIFNKGTAGSWAAGNTSMYLSTAAGGGNTAGTFPGMVRNSGGWLVGNQAVNTGTWQLITITDNAGTKSIYTNNGVVNTLGQAQLTTNDVGTEIRLGWASDGGDGANNLNGALENVALYNTALTAASASV